MRKFEDDDGNGGHRVRWMGVLAIVLAVSAPTPLAANTPPPPPRKLTEDFGFTCLMLSDQRTSAHLSISIRFEPLSVGTFSRKAYWWKLSGETEHYRSNETFMNMRSVESELSQSMLHFDAADGWSYSYLLHYAVEERFPEFVYVPDHLVVRRKRTDDQTSVWQLVGIGECHLANAAQ